MTASEIVAEVSAVGGQIVVDGFDLIVRHVPRRLAEAIKEHKTQIVELLAAEANPCHGGRLWHRFATARDDAGQPFSRCLDCAHANPEPVLRRDPSDASIEAARLLREGRWPPTLPVCAFHCGKPGETCRRCGAPWEEHYPRANGDYE